MCPGAELTLLYRASSEADVVFRAELDEIARRRHATVIYLIGRSSDPANAVTGEALCRLVLTLQKRDVFLCASPALARAMKAALRDVGLPRAAARGGFSSKDVEPVRGRVRRTSGPAAAEA